MKNVYGRPILKAKILRQEITAQLLKTNDRHFVYFLCNGYDIIYIGRTSHLLTRLWQHKNNRIFDAVILFEYCTQKKSRQHEKLIIKHHQPIENRMWVNPI